MATSQLDAAPAAPQTAKPIHSLILDTGPLIKNDPSVDVLRTRAEVLYTLPSIIPEIRDAVTRARVETTLLPFVTIRAPKPASVKFVRDFARRTGDLEVMSRPDVEILALGYEIECERNGGDWRLRNMPGQKGVNGKPPVREVKEGEMEGEATEATEAATEEVKESAEPTEESLENAVQNLQLDAPSTETEPETQESQDIAPIEENIINSDEDSTASDDDGSWITPTNLQKHKTKDSSSLSATQGKTPATLQCAVLTSDFAMQNVALRMNLNLVSPALTRISKLRTWVLRCHACFATTSAMEKRFCPRCGQATLLRAACTIDDRTGALTIHLKKNFQWNNRGNVYSVPKPVHGSSHGRAPKGRSDFGGKDGWGRDLIFAEDQKEYSKANEELRRERRRDVMDEDWVPGLVSGRREGRGGKVRVGAGRNVNSKRKH